MVISKRTGNVDHFLRRTAFTLMEMLVVVAIIVVLAGVGGAYLMGRLDESKVSAAQAQAKVISGQVKAYQVEHNGMFPQSLEVLLQKDADGKGPYFETVDAVKDPWGQQYRYDPSGALNSQKGALVVIPDVYTTTPDGRMVGNFK